MKKKPAARAISAALHTPQLGGPTMLLGVKIQSRRHGFFKI